MWVTPQAVRAWYYQGPTQWGAQYTFSDVALQTALTLRRLYHLPLSQTEGSVGLIFIFRGGFYRCALTRGSSRSQRGLLPA